MAMRHESLRNRVIGRGARNFRAYAELAEQHEERTWSSNGTANRVQRLPAGPAVVITPWNAPFMLATWKLAPALAAGNPVVLKPAEWSPLLLWILPLSVAPPMFSRDVYSYLAQSEIAARGLDPYAIGPKAALGVDHVLTRTVPTIWRDTPAPYGPFFLWLGRGISSLTGDNIVAGIFLHI